jgi:hypothetical protein
MKPSLSKIPLDRLNLCTSEVPFLRQIRQLCVWPIPCDMISETVMREGRNEHALEVNKNDCGAEDAFLLPPA